MQLVRLFQTVDVDVPYAVLLLAAINTPFQGLPNCLVYLYPKFAKLTRTKPELGFWGRVRKSVAIGASKSRVDDLIEQRLDSHEEGEEPTAGDIGENAVIFFVSTPSSSENSIELVGDRETIREENSAEVETKS